MTIDKLTGKEFEAELLYRIEECEAQKGAATMVRYGVEARLFRRDDGRQTIPDYMITTETLANIGNIPVDIFRKVVSPSLLSQIVRYFSSSSQNDDGLMWTPVESLPDFDGVLKGGRQFIIEAKVCSQASFPINDDKFSNRQIAHLKKRARFGAISLLVVHFNRRQLTKLSVPPFTVAFPVCAGHPIWDAHTRGELKSIGKEEIRKYGIPVPWNVAQGKRKSSPDVLPAIMRAADLIDSSSWTNSFETNNPELEKASEPEEFKLT